MIAEIILGWVIVGLFALLAWEKHENKKERAKWMNALIAKTPEQYRDLELTEKVKPIEPPVPKEPEFVPESDIPDEKFQELIEKEIG